MRKTAVLLALMAMSMSDVFAATGKIVTTDYVAGALESLDAAQVGASGSYIQYVSETNGIVSATAKAFDTSMSSTSTNAVQNKVVNTALGKKQDKLSTAQLNAVNSGITAAKVSTYDGYASGKQDTLVPDTNIKGSGSVTVTKGTDGVITVSGTDTVYTLPTATSSTLGGVKVDTALSSTSTNPVQNKAVYSALSGKLSATGTAAKATADASGNNIVNTYATKTALNEGLATKQDTLVPDTNIKGSGSVTVTKGTDGVITVSGTDNNTTYTAGTNITITNGVISAKDTVYTLPTATSSTLGGVKVDTALSSTSTNPVQNKAVYSALSGKLSATGTAAKATADASGNNIVNTYATKTALSEGLATKQDTLVPDTNIKGSGSVTVTKGTDGVITVSGTDTVYTLPTATSSTLGGVKVDTALSSTSTNPVQNKAVNTAISNLQTAVNGKQATLTTTNVTTSGSGNVVTAVTASNGTVTVTKGTTLGSLATKSAVGSSDITDGSIANADIANGAVTAVKTTGIFGFIPSGSEGASATATIWVE